MMGRDKVLYGVEHIDSETQRVASALEGLNFQRLGLEIPPNYQELEKVGLLKGFFIDLASQTRGKYEIDCLDDIDLHSESLSILFAQEMEKNSDLEKQVRGEYDHFTKRKRFIAPEALGATPKYYDMINRALSLTEEYRGSPESLDRMLGTNWTEIEEIMLRRILEKGTDVVVVGKAHGDILTKNLPEHKYIPLTDKTEASCGIRIIR